MDNAITTQTDQKGVLIVVLTWKRLELLKKLVDKIQIHTRTPYELVISTATEDNDAIQYAASRGITCFHSKDQGPGRLRNQGYWYFWHHTNYETIIQLEDDADVWELGWEEDWVAAANRWGIVCYAYNAKQESSFGDNKWDKPIWTTDFGFHATAINRGAMALVGFSNPEFVGYGWDDADLGNRYAIALRHAGVWTEGTNRHHPCLNCHVGVDFEKSNYDPESFNRNKDLYYAKKASRTESPDEGVWICWSDMEDRSDFLNGIKTGIRNKSPDEPGLCLFCRGRGDKMLEKDGFTMRHCHGLVMSFPYKNEQEYDAYYSGDYHGQCQRNEGQKAYWDRDEDLYVASDIRLHLIRAIFSKGAPFKPGTTLLDIGAGTGAFVAAANDQGIMATGVEVNEPMCDQAQEKGRPVQAGSAYQVDIDEQFDIVHLSDVFEHLLRPADALGEMMRVMKDSGLLVIEMPEAGCPQSEQQGPEWRHYRPKQHVYLYTEGAARMLFERHGLYVEAVHRPLRGSLGKITYYLQKMDCAKAGQ